MPTWSPPRAPRVLLVDDAIDEREMYAEYFRRSGFCTLQAENVADACRLASELGPDIVVTDFRLFGQADGADLARRLRASHDTAAVPIVVLSASSQPRDRDTAIGAGCDLFLPKPCLPDELARAVVGILVSVRPNCGAESPSDARGVS